MFAKQRFTNSENYCLTFSGSIDTQTAKRKGNAYLRKKVFLNSNNSLLPMSSRLDVGMNYDTTKDEVTYKMTLKKSFDVTKDGLTTLNVRGGANFALQTMNKPPQFEGRVELAKTKFNFLPDQDVQLKLGIDGRQTKGELYGEIRENNWRFSTNFKNRWEFQYDL